MMDYLNCNHCKKSLKHSNVDCLFWCNKECEEAQNIERKNKRKKSNENHNPPARRGETDHTNDIIKALLRQKISSDDDMDVNVDKPKSGRKCGKCGKSGHNARTCKE